MMADSDNYKFNAIQESPDSSQNSLSAPDSNIFLAIHKDIEDLLKQFEACGSIRFDDFAKIWVQKKFSFIFWGITRFPERFEITEEMLRIAISYTQPPNSFQYCVGGLYLSYSLYLKQLIKPKVRIRVTIKQWQCLQDLLCLAVQQKHLDMIYIFRWLQFSHAFDFVLFSKLQYGPWNLKCKKKLSFLYDVEDDSIDSKRGYLRNYLQEGHMNILSVMHKNYEDMKFELKKSGAIDRNSTSSLQTVSEDIGEKVKKDFESFISKGCMIASRSGDVTEDSQNSSNEEDTIANRRKKLKQNQFARSILKVQTKFSHHSEPTS